MQNALMKFDPATGEQRPYPSHAAQWRKWHGSRNGMAFRSFDGAAPRCARRRQRYTGLLIVPSGTLGMDMGGGCAEKDNA